MANNQKLHAVFKVKLERVGATSFKREHGLSNDGCLGSSCFRDGPARHVAANADVSGERGNKRARGPTRKRRCRSLDTSTVIIMMMMTVSPAPVACV